MRRRGRAGSSPAKKLWLDADLCVAGKVAAKCQSGYDGGAASEGLLLSSRGGRRTIGMGGRDRDVRRDDTEWVGVM